MKNIFPNKMKINFKGNIKNKSIALSLSYESVFLTQTITSSLFCIRIILYRAKGKVLQQVFLSFKELSFFINFVKFSSVILCTSLQRYLRKCNTLNVQQDSKSYVNYINSYSHFACSKK